MEMGESLERAVIDCINEPTLSIDRCTMLIYSPKLSMWSYRLDESDSFVVKRQRENLNNFIDALEKRYFHLFDNEALCSNGTKLYEYHKRLKGGIDLQAIAKYGVKHRVKDRGYVEAFGDDLDKENGYITEYIDSDYNIRIEWNPNKGNITEVMAFLQDIASAQKHIDLSRLIKITRLDVAIDYPMLLNPALIECRKMRKYFIAGGKDGVETLNFGALRSKYFFCIYDKKKEYFQQQKSYYAGDYLWRFELRCHEAFSFEDLPDLYEVWRRLDIFESGKSTGDHVFDMLLFYGKQFGMSSVFKPLPRSTANRYRKIYQEFCSSPMRHPSQVYLEQMYPAWGNFCNQLREVFGRGDVTVKFANPLIRQDVEPVTPSQEYYQDVLWGR